MITFENVSKRYPGGSEVLKNINFTIQKGEFIALIGPSGCGKTTTMKMINRLIEPSKGRILIEGEDIAKRNPVELRRNIGYVIQQIGLLPHMTIAENISIVPRLKGWDAPKYERRVEELLDLVGLDPSNFKNRYPSELSGGQQQRVGVIRALAAEPAIVLMDEPFSALDPISREQLQDELVNLQESIKKTIVFVTHDMDEAIKVADRIAIMKEGNIMQFDTPDRILRHPADDFVKGFIGEQRLENGIGQSPTAEDLMISKLVTARPTRGLAEAMKIMRTYKVDSLLVTDHQQRFVGVATLESVRSHFGDEDKKLKDILLPNVRIIEKGDPYTEVAEIFATEGLTSIPVIENGRLVGLITRASMMRGLAGIDTDQQREGGINLV